MHHLNLAPVPARRIGTFALRRRRLSSSCACLIALSLALLSGHVAAQTPADWAGAWVVDLSGSMNSTLSSNPSVSRCDAAKMQAKKDIEVFFDQIALLQANNPNFVAHGAVYGFQGSSVTQVTSGFTDEVGCIAAINSLSSCSGLTPLAAGIDSAITDMTTAFPNLPAPQRQLYIYSDGDENSSPSGTLGLPNAPYPTHHATVGNTCAPGLNTFAIPNSSATVWQLVACNLIVNSAIVNVYNFDAFDMAGVPFLSALAVESGGSYIDVTANNYIALQGLPVKRRGRGCADGGGTTLAMQWRGLPHAGQIMEFRCDVSLFSTYYLAFGLSDSWAGNIPLPYDLGQAVSGSTNGCFVFQSSEFVQSDCTISGAWEQVVIPASLVGVNFFVQGFNDNSFANGFPLVTSDYLSVKIQP